MIVSDVPPAVSPNPQPVAHTSHCRTHRCWHKVSVRRHIAWAWRYYKRHPMPSCTWLRESGDYNIGQWSALRYRARNPNSTAGGKFQVLYSTWLGAGGPAVGNAANARPLDQEKYARVVLRRWGPSQWVNC